MRHPDAKERPSAGTEEGSETPTCAECVCSARSGLSSRSCRKAHLCWAAKHQGPQHTDFCGWLRMRFPMGRIPPRRETHAKPNSERRRGSTPKSDTVVGNGRPVGHNSFKRVGMVWRQVGVRPHLSRWHMEGRLSKGSV